MRIVVSLLILLILAGQASANEEMSSILDVSGQEGTQALGWLQALFGGWVGTWNGEANIVSVVGGLFNVLALTFAMIASIYVLIAGAVRTAHEGEVMGKSWSTVWLPVRSAIGLGLLMPTAIGGGTISVVQALIMYCALVGSNAADLAWSRAVEFISTGTPIHAPAPVGATEFSRQLFRSLVCVESMKYAGLPAEISKNGDGWTFGSRGECGAIALPKPSKEALADRVKVAATGFSDQGFEIKDRVRAALIPVIATHITAMEKVARAFVLGPGQGGLIGGAQGLDDKIDPSGEGYQNVLAVSSSYNIELARFQAGVAAAVQAAVGGSEYGAKYAELLKKGGWTSAGVWTFQISRIQDAATEATATTLSAAKANAAPGDCPSSQSFLSSVAAKLGTWFVDAH